MDGCRVGEGERTAGWYAVAPNEIVARMWKDVLADNGINCLL
jgi:hypothetical protein